LVLFDKDPGSYVPYQHQEMFQGYRFAPMPLPLFDVRGLAGFDTLVVADICNANAVLTSTQKQVITDWVYTGNKLIITDSDLCTSSDYSFLPYSFQTSNPGRRGAHGDHLIVVEPNALGSERNDPVHFVDTAGYVDNPSNQLGDANVVTTKDSHWCGHLFGTNVSGDSGYMQIYAPYGRGLIIYDGLDRDDVVVPQYSRILQLELDLPANALLPCSQSVAGDFSIAPSVEYAFTPGKAESARIQLQALANHGYSGTVKLSAESPTGVNWHADLSTQQVSLGGKVAPFDFTVAIPQDARPGRYVFTVAGTDERGKTARAFVALSSLKTVLTAVRTLQSPKSPHIAKTLATKKRVTVYGIYFDFASDTIRPESAAVLKEIADALRANPAWKLTIEGYTDNVGGADYNLDLSIRRAAAVKRALVNNFHVQADRLNTVGYGFSRPKASNDTPEGRALNRRVELVRR
jgi:outer membrane protein OmpA-like peptidoglycan-associated protein